MKQITVTIKKDASVVVETNGFTGSSCKEATQRLESALGAVTNTDLKPDYYDAEIDQQQGQGT